MGARPARRLTRAYGPGSGEGNGHADDARRPPCANNGQTVARWAVSRTESPVAVVGVLSQRLGYLHATPDLAIGQVGVSCRASARGARVIGPARGGAVAKRIFSRSSTAGQTASIFGCRAHKNSRDNSHLPTKEGSVCLAGGDATLVSAGRCEGSRFPLTPCARNTHAPRRIMWSRPHGVVRGRESATSSHARTGGRVVDSRYLPVGLGLGCGADSEGSPFIASAADPSCALSSLVDSGPHLAVGFLADAASEACGRTTLGCRDVPSLPYIMWQTHGK